MKYQKIRGHKRRHKAIEGWRSENLVIRLDSIKKYNYDYVKIFGRPWRNLSLINSAFPEPKGKTKQLMLNSLIDIYYSWKKQLDEIGEPYYLKIWLYEPRFSKSQVVCGIRERIDRYENIFFDANEDRELQTSNYGHLKDKLDELSWEHRIDEDDIENDYVGEPEQYLTYADFVESKKWFTKTMKKPHRTYEFENGRELYSFRKGSVWIGGQD